METVLSRLSFCLLFSVHPSGFFFWFYYRGVHGDCIFQVHQDCLKCANTTILSWRWITLQDVLLVELDDLRMDNHLIAYYWSSCCSIELIYWCNLLSISWSLMRVSMISSDLDCFIVLLCIFFIQISYDKVL